MVDGILSRWSQRKTLARQGVVLTEPVAPPIPVSAAPVLGPTSQPEPPQAATLPGPGAQPPPELTLDDVQALTPASDFSPFVARTVAPQVRNAAMKKLFADPHYNVMDRLDIYIDDYNLADPLPASMLRQMVSAQFLKLVDTPAEEVSAPAAETAPLAEAAPLDASAPMPDQTPTPDT